MKLKPNIHHPVPLPPVVATCMRTLQALDVKYQESLKLITADAAHLARSISVSPT